MKKSSDKGNLWIDLGFYILIFSLPLAVALLALAAVLSGIITRFLTYLSQIGV